MIPYEELCAAIDRWRGRESASYEPATPQQYQEPADQYQAPTPEPVQHDTTNEIDVDSIESLDV